METGHRDSPGAAATYGLLLLPAPQAATGLMAQPGIGPCFCPPEAQKDITGGSNEGARVGSQARNAHTISLSPFFQHEY